MRRNALLGRPSLSSITRALLHAVLSAAIASGALGADAVPRSPAVEESVEADEPAQTASPKDDPAAQPYWQALKLFRDGTEADWKRGRELLNESADLEFTHAQNLLGSCLLHGNYGYKKNAKKAAALFELAAARNSGFAALNIGLCYFSGTGVRKDMDAATKWLQVVVSGAADFDVPPPPADYVAKAREAGASDATVSGSVPGDEAEAARATAHLILGEIFSASRQLSEAHTHYVAAATAGPGGRAGVAQAAVKAAINLAFGHGAKRDLAKANEMLERSKKLGRRFGMVYAHALVQNKALDDFAQADLEEEIAAAMQTAHYEIQADIAGSLADPKSKDYNPQEAAKWYELAAESGAPWPMLSLAFLHHEGRLGKPDPAKAYHFFRMAAEKGNHTLAHANMAICLLHGIGTEKNPAQASEIFSKYRDDDIVCHLGTVGQAPTSIVTYEQVLELNRVWARRKDAQANYLMGKRYLYGWGVKADLDEAGTYFERAAKANHAKAMCELGVLYEAPGFRFEFEWPEKYSRAAEWFKKSADRGFAPAMVNLAYCHRAGRGVPKDEDKAIELYEKALTLDPTASRALNNLGAIYSDRFDAAVKSNNAEKREVNRRKMLEYYEAAEKLNDARAAQNLGFLMYNGSVGEKDYEKAYTYFTKAAEAGESMSRRMLGSMHEKGHGVPVTLREAAYHYRLAALQGDTPALVALCDFYLLGKGVSQDFDRAWYWLRMLANRGVQGAVMALGDVTLKKKDYANARQLFRDLLDADSPRLRGYANERLSWMYQNGWGVTANPKRAARYHAKAIELGDREALHRSGVELMRAGKKAEALPLLEKAAATLPAAKYSLGYLRLTGPEGIKDEAKGWALIRQAAAADHGDAQLALANATLKGIPGAPSLGEAIQLAEAAESAGHPAAKTVREKLEARRKQ